MISRRAILAGALAAIPSRILRDSVMIPTIAITFDVYDTTYSNALWDMVSKGIPGTFFADCDKIGTAGNPSKDNLILMAANGWEIGARVYRTIAGAEANMVAVWLNNRGVACDRLMAQKTAMHNLGFDIKSIAASQRQWSPQLRGVASHLFENVRVANNVTTPPTFQAYPIPDPLYVQNGGTNSWGGSDTVASLSAQLDGLIANGGLWIPIIHRVDTTGDPAFTVQTSVFQGFTSYLQSKIAAGQVRAVTFRDAVKS